MKIKSIVLLTFFIAFTPLCANLSVENKCEEAFSVSKKNTFFPLKSFNGISSGDLLRIYAKKSERVYLYPSGISCGVKLITDGVLVISTARATNERGAPVSPAADAGILPGDYILSANGISIKNSEHFSRVINSCGDHPLKLDCLRNEKTFQVELAPVSADGKKRYIGMWVRDSTAGLGTLTYITGDKKEFAALGHSVSDEDTGKLMRLSEGELITSSVVSVKKGLPGSPGELTGVFDEPEILIGKITDNSSEGIYGTLSSDEILSSDAKPLPAATRHEISCGKAAILCSAKTDTPFSYEVKIIKVSDNNHNEGKDMIIEVTDPSLLEITGGIVQGMSGSPILQNGKIVGAVTHVFVNDPTRGYGIFIENMLAEAEKIK